MPRLILIACSLKWMSYIAATDKKKIVFHPDQSLVGAEYWASQLLFYTNRCSACPRQSLWRWQSRCQFQTTRAGFYLLDMPATYLAWLPHYTYHPSWMPSKSCSDLILGGFMNGENCQWTVSCMWQLANVMCSAECFRNSPKAMKLYRIQK